MGKWITCGYPKERHHVLVKILLDGIVTIRIGYMKYSAGDKNSPHFIVPKYEIEDMKTFQVLGWMELPEV